MLIRSGRISVIPCNGRCDVATGRSEMLIEYRGEVLPGCALGLPKGTVKVQRKAGPF